MARTDPSLSLCSYIHKKTGGVQEYLCNKLFQLSDVSLEGILPQLCELAAKQPLHSNVLQQSLIGLCNHSTRLALKV